MSVYKLLRIEFNEGLVKEELWELRDTLHMFGFKNMSRVKSNILEIECLDPMTEVRSYLSNIASWTGRIALDQHLMSIEDVNVYNLDYDQPEICELLAQSIK